jgi:hypothetical protein
LTLVRLNIVIIFPEITSVNFVYYINIFQSDLFTIANLEIIIKIIVIVLYITFILMPFVIAGWLIIHAGRKFQRRRISNNFFSRSRNEFIMAVQSYERSFGEKAEINSETYKDWKLKYGYLRDFIGEYNKSGLDKEYKRIIEKYINYVNQYSPPVYFQNGNGINNQP